MPSRLHNEPPFSRSGGLLARWWRGGEQPLATGGWRPGDDVTGAVDASCWDVALQRAAVDPRAVPLSAVRLRIEAPGLTGPGKTAELARLQHIAVVSWREILRPADTLAQVGPSEFAVLLPRCDGRAAEMIAGRLQAAVPEAARCRAGVATSARGDAGRLSSDAARALAATAQQRDPLSDPARLAVVEAVRSAVAEADAAPALQALSAGTAALLGVPAVAVTLVDAGRHHVAGAHGLETLDGYAPGRPVDLSLARQAVAGRRPVLVSDTARHGVEHTARAELRLGVTACASVPMTVDGEIVGTVCALRPERYEWTVDDAAVLRVAAERAEEQLALALRVARSPLTA